MRFYKILHLLLSSYLDGQSSPFFILYMKFNCINLCQCLIKSNSNVWFSYDCTPLNSGPSIAHCGECRDVSNKHMAQ